jgi:hypothetical protein
MATNLGPVGPHEPILTDVGNERVIAFYELIGGHCAFHAVVWNTTDLNADSAGGFQANLSPRQMAPSIPLRTSCLISNAVTNHFLNELDRQRVGVAGRFESHMERPPGRSSR